MKKNLLFVALLAGQVLCAQQTSVITPLDGEYWWGAVVAQGSAMPYVQPQAEFNLETQDANNQLVPLFLSNKGRYVWSEYPFRFSVSDGQITIRSDYETLMPAVAGTTLRDAYRAACKAHFAPQGTLPDTLFFTMPQYNTWIELMYDQNQADILRYAHSIIDNGFPAGVLMIDDNWQRYYGNFDFKTERFPNPKAMIDELHALGFKVMLWICPFVSPDSPEYRTWQAKGYLLQRPDGQPAVLEWWNGQSACFDLTNPQAANYFVALLENVQQTYGIDGFKFDAGDNNCYAYQELKPYQAGALTVDHTLSWAKIGLRFPFNEYRAGWKTGGAPLVQRLGDKDYSWQAVQALIPDMLAAGLLGYAYTCPDMIGGGQFTAFLGLNAADMDQELIVRSAQVHSLMPMMQFSVAPWRVLSAENLQIVRNMALLHERMGAYIMQYARAAAQTGEPIVRHLEYAFPNEDFAQCKDQFMLGDKYLVAPMVTPGNQRMVHLPKGLWKDELGNKYKGGRFYQIEVPLNRLPYFEKLK